MSQYPGDRLGRNKFAAGAVSRRKGATCSRSRVRFRRAAYSQRVGMGFQRTAGAHLDFFPWRFGRKLYGVLADFLREAGEYHELYQRPRSAMGRTLGAMILLFLEDTEFHGVW